jgi:hypothetical protein
MIANIKDNRNNIYECRNIEAVVEPEYIEVGDSYWVDPRTNIVCEMWSDISIYEAIELANHYPFPVDLFLYDMGANGVDQRSGHPLIIQRMAEQGVTSPSDLKRPDFLDFEAAMKKSEDEKITDEFPYDDIEG